VAFERAVFPRALADAVASIEGPALGGRVAAEIGVRPGSKSRSISRTVSMSTLFDLPVCAFFDFVLV
jgi:hypothetical protein